MVQDNWLETTLEGSSARYKFIFAHHMTGGSDDYVRGGANPTHLVEWGGFNEAGTANEWTTKRPATSGWGSKPIHQMLVANDVSGFFHGHDHQYAYEKRDGVVYQSVPIGSFTGNFGIYTTNSGYTIWADATQTYGRLKITVGPGQTTVDYIKTGATVPAYTYAITPAALTYRLTVAADPPGGGATLPTAGVHTPNQHTIVDVTAEPAAGCVFDHWSGVCAGAGACQVTMDGDRSVTAHFTVRVNDVTISGSGNYAKLDWTHRAVAVAHYEVHRSLTAPYFAPDAATWLDDVTPSTPPTAPPEDLGFPDPTADLTAAGNTCFYAVVPLDTSSQPLGNYSRTGAFVFGLVLGTVEP